MPRSSSDPLIPLPVRFPTSTVERLRARADASGVTLSDMLRSHLTLDAAKPLGKPVPRRRVSKLASVSGLDPVLLRQLASIGSNVNQLAHQVNAGALAGTTMDALALLTELQQIERHLRAIAEFRS